MVWFSVVVYPSPSGVRVRLLQTSLVGVACVLPSTARAQTPNASQPTSQAASQPTGRARTDACPPEYPTYCRMVASQPTSRPAVLAPASRIAATSRPASPPKATMDLPHWEIGARRGAARAEQLLDEGRRRFGKLALPWWRWRYASGNWLGARNWLDARGLTLEMLYTGDTAYAAAETRGMSYRGLAELIVAFNSERPGLWPGGRLVFILHQMHGHSATGHQVNDVQFVSNIDGPERTQVAALWYHQHLFNDKLRLKIGRQDANVDLAGAVLGAEFVHSSFGLPPNVPLPTYPDPGLGALVGFSVGPLDVDVGIYDGAPKGHTHGFDTTFDQRGGFVTAGQVTLRTSALIDGVKVGYLTAGGFFHSGGKGDAAAPVAERSWGLYGILEQPLWVRGRHRLAVLGQYSWASELVAGVRSYAGGGLAFQGILPLAGNDLLGAGLSRAWLHEGHETVVEVFYKLGLTAAAFIQLDAQYLHHPGGAGHDAWIGIFRFSLQI